MEKYIKLTERRKEIIDQFKITDRDEHIYKSLDEAIEDALNRSFKDINFRTLHEKSECQKLVEKCLQLQDEEIAKYCDFCKEKDTVKEIFVDTEGQVHNITNYLIARLKKEDFINKFVVYFSDETPHKLNESFFDAWHHEACTIFLNILKKYYPDAEYGKAQKIVNMMFKHLYCMKFEKNEKKDKSDWRVLNGEYFEHCHLTLDSFTLEWFWREAAEKWYNKKDVKDRGDQIHKSKIDSWSNLEYLSSTNTYEEYKKVKYRCKDDENCRLIKVGEKYFYHYTFFVTVIREFFKGNPKTTDEQTRYDGKTPFQAEFYIWPDIQLHLTAEALFGQSIGQEETMEELEKETGTKFSDFNAAQKQYKSLDRSTKVKILKKKIECIEKIW